jgi:flavin-dependent dehydrogenase
VCGGFLSPGAVEDLYRLGVLDDVRRAGAIEVTSARIRMDLMEIEIRFKRPGLGISRRALDEVVARGTTVREGCLVTEVIRTEKGFCVTGPNLEAACTVVVDAAGKLSRFSRRATVDEFGIQFSEGRCRGNVMDFWFFEDGYGGAVSIEGGRSNCCFLISKGRLPLYLDRPDCLVTGPLAYDRLPGDFIAIGDAAGMVDPFCGEGMRQALDTGMLAARIVARGIRARAAYEDIRREYEFERTRRWSRKRAAGATFRRLLKQRGIFRAALQLMPAGVLDLIWD